MPTSSQRTFCLPEQATESKSFPAATMPNTAESHSHTVPTNRNCTIEITNITSSIILVNPNVHLESGFAYNPPQPTIRSNKPEVCSFIKDDNTASGAVGVMTYDMFDTRTRQCSEKMAVMFSVPFDYNFYKNWIGVGIYGCQRDCDESLYKEMYNSKEQKLFVRHEADGSGVAFRGTTQEVRATMSNEGQAIIKLELYDKMG